MKKRKARNDNLFTHFFVAVQRAVIDNAHKLEEKQELLQLMKDVLTLTSSSQQQQASLSSPSTAAHVHDSNFPKTNSDSSALELGLKYKVLNCDIDLLPKDTPEFQRISELVLTDSDTNSTHTHIDIENVFRVRRKGEWEKFTDSIFNTKMLFHGSKIGK